jgi:hypothetical protein
MGNKSDMQTIEGKRRMAHETVDRFFNTLDLGPDGQSVDEILVEERRDVSDTSRKAFLSRGNGLIVAVEYSSPKVVSETSPILQCDEGVFTLANPSPNSVNALVRFLLDTPGALMREADEADIVAAIEADAVLMVGLGINELARRTNLNFDALPGSEPVEQTITEEAASSQLAEDQREADNKLADTLAQATAESEARAAEARREAEEAAAKAEREAQEAADKARAELEAREAEAKAALDAASKDPGWQARYDDAIAAGFGPEEAKEMADSTKSAEEAKEAKEAKEDKEEPEAEGKSSKKKAKKS